ncbi:MAG: hypothetical protein JJU01_10090, partial [Alkalibacterium sp.]|nr:hypothetical protein [Alkalibacterium sp.]
MEKKSEQTYSTVNNMMYLYKEIWNHDKRLILHVILAGVSEMILPLATLGLTALVIDAVAETGNVGELIPMFGALLLLVLTLTIISKTSTNTLNYQGNGFRVNTLNKIAIRLTTIDFEMFDGNEGQEKINKALDTASSPEQVFQRIFLVSEAAVKNSLGFLIYSYLLAEIHWLFIL